MASLRPVYISSGADTDIGCCHPITSAARPSTDNETESPRDLAFLRVITSSSFVICCTGKSAGLSPDRLRGERLARYSGGTRHTGIGIAAEDMEKIFEPMFTTKSTDMGLWICRAIVESYGGQLKSRSRIGERSIFQIELPIDAVTQRG